MPNIVRSSDDGLSKLKSSFSGTAVSSEDPSRSMELPKSAEKPTPSKSIKESLARSHKEFMSLPESSPSPHETPKNDENESAATSLPRKGDSSSAIGEMIDKDRKPSMSGPSLMVNAELSDAPFSVPLHVIQTVTAELPTTNAQVDHGEHGWSVSMVCPTEARRDDGTSLHSLPFKDESESQDLDVASLPQLPEKIQDTPAVLFPGFSTARGTHDLVRAWKTKFLVSPPIAVSHERLRDASLIKCDINPKDGRFLSPVIQPETVRSLSDGLARDYNDIAWRQSNMTSELHIKREVKSRESVANALRTSLEHVVAPNPAAEIEEAIWPDAKCVVRPAAPSDFAEIAEIINSEARNSRKAQIFETRMATVEDVSKIFKACVASDRPFIVARPSQEDFLDRGKWPKNSDLVYEEFAKYVAVRPRPVSPIVGFAFITDYRVGLFGAPCPGSRFSGQLRLVVHPDHRHKMYGSALLDRILLSVSPFHQSAVDHVWECDSARGVYEFPTTINKRQYIQLYLELFCEQKPLPDYKWRAEFLGKFGFQEVGYLKNAAVQMDDQYHNNWFNMVLWQRDITPTTKLIGRYELPL